MVQSNIEWAKQHAELADGKWMCRKTGLPLAVVHLDVRVWEDERGNDKTPEEAALMLRSARHIEPAKIDHLCCHECGEGEQFNLRVLYQDLVWDLGN